VTLGGKKISLGVQGRDSRKAAIEAWHRLMAGGTVTKLVDRDPPTVAAVIEGFLKDAEGRVKPRALAWYRDLLGPFKGRPHGITRAADLTAP
jgi:hypothetical protein